MRRAAFLTGVAGLCLGAHAQVIAWNAGNGDWSLAGNWDGANIPDAAGESALLDIAGMYTVQYDAAGAFDSISITNPTAGVAIEVGRTMSLLAPAVVNHGSIRVLGSTITATDAVLRFEASGTVSGPGKIQLEDNADAIMTGPVGVIVTNAADHSIVATGTIGIDLNNLGLVSANFTGQTMHLLNPIANGGVVEATNDGTLDFNGGANLTQTGAGVLRGDNGLVRFLGSQTVGGGTIESMNTGLFTRESGGTTTLSGVAFAGGEFQVEIGGTLAIDGTLTNDALVRCLGSTISGTDSTCRLVSTAVFAGTGMLRLEDGADAILTADGGVAGTNGIQHTIAGTGTILAPLTNNGLISADVLGQTMFLGAAMTNNADVEAINGAVFQFNAGSDVVQGAVGLIACDDSTVLFTASQTITSGTLLSTNGGFFSRQSGGTTTLVDVDFDAGELRVQLGGTLAIAGSGLVNDGLIRALGSSISGTDSTIWFAETGSLTGAGEIRLEETTDAVLSGEVGVVVMQAAGHSITGAGRIVVEMVNDGTISADLNGHTIDLEALMQNNAVIRALPGGTLDINEGADVMQGASGVIRSDGALVRLVGTHTITGGMLDGPNAGIFTREASGKTTLVDVTVAQGEIQVELGGVVEVLGSGLVNNGLVRVLGSTISSTDANLRFAASGSLSGTGEVRLEDGADAILSETNGSTIVQEAGHSITGSGVISAPLVNEGRIAPGLSAGVLNIGGGVTLEATSLLDVELGGTATSAFDRLIGNGPKGLGGTLKVSLINAYVPAKNSSYAIVSGSGGVTGTFASVQGVDTPEGLRWVVNYAPTSATLRLVCLADCEGDGYLDVFDFLCFQGEYATQTAYGDCENDGDWDVFDFLCFQGQFATCP